MPRRKSEIDPDNTDRWLLTYADLITLLLAFFVIMYSISKIDISKFDKMTDRLQGVFHAGDATVEEASDQSDLGSGVLKVGRLKVASNKLKKLAKDAGEEKASVGMKSAVATRRDSTTDAANGMSNEPMTVEINERGLVIHILESALFESGQAALRPGAIEMLKKVSKEIRDLPNQIRIEGHTDNRPIATTRYPSNWELSSARATSVVRFLIDEEQFSPDKLSALGFGEFRPIAPNDSDTDRAKNRRIDIVVLTDDLSRYEPASIDTAWKESVKRNDSTGNKLQVSAEQNSPH